MTKIEFITTALQKLNIPLTTGGRYNKDLVAIINDGYRGHISSAGYTKLVKKWFPDKAPKVHIFNYLCQINNVKYCSKCENLLDVEYFHINNAQKDGKQTACKNCYYDEDRKTYLKGKSAERRAYKNNRTPEWSNINEINDFYAKCPTGYHVDHIIPLKGEKVSGLHVINNLQYLKAEENLKKGNKFSVL